MFRDYFSFKNFKKEPDAPPIILATENNQEDYHVGPELMRWSEYKAAKSGKMSEDIMICVYNGAIQRAIDERRPISLWAVPENATPPGYAREGDIYVYCGENLSGQPEPEEELSAEFKQKFSGERPYEYCVPPKPFELMDFVEFEDFATDHNLLSRLQYDCVASAFKAGKKVLAKNADSMHQKPPKGYKREGDFYVCR